MTTKHVNAKERWSSYLKRRVQIVTLYNENTPIHQENPQIEYESLTHPQLLHCFYSPEAQGGVLVEQLVGNEECALITFMAIEESKRGQGLGGEILAFAQKQMVEFGSQIVGVQINDADERAFWNKSGYVEEIPHQNVTVLLKQGQ
ncbi:GNAT family N-acetyltransferase [Vibrio coralliilyticus]|uniref:GNAT family N-acetyltransferase n=1 Tax=Vibrio coralliilyticus TaxID=190893 RepID=A0AAP6ZUH3_9VIBR|nr:GNAT family N-acetyltransferase [Vibrio coralliilyticus]NOI32279.1 GNAT family N-acetyltransferase [Vibrio coralliilyticus]NOJ25322.1 GNAT family N-acetyltransferase [Vibrio coralliilyticus]